MDSAIRECPHLLYHSYQLRIFHHNRITRRCGNYNNKCNCIHRIFNLNSPLDSSILVAVMNIDRISRKFRDRARTTTSIWMKMLVVRVDWAWKMREVVVLVRIS